MPPTMMDTQRDTSQDEPSEVNNTDLLDALAGSTGDTYVGPAATDGGDGE